MLREQRLRDPIGESDPTISRARATDWCDWCGRCIDDREESTYCSECLYAICDAQRYEPPDVNDHTEGPGGKAKEEEKAGLC